MKQYNSKQNTQVLIKHLCMEWNTMVMIQVLWLITSIFILRHFFIVQHIKRWESAKSSANYKMLWRENISRLFIILRTEISWKLVFTRDYFSWFWLTHDFIYAKY